jgi:hypothetical protein
MYLTVFLCLLLPSDGRRPAQDESDSRMGETAIAAVDPAVLVAKCKKMDVSDYADFVKGLGMEHDFASLEVLYNAHGLDHSFAAAIACINMPDEKAVDFCRQFEEGSGNWEAAFSCLYPHSTKAVRDYVKKVAKSRKCYRLICCYDLCKEAHWDDLLEEAKRDSTDYVEIPYKWLNAPIGLKESVGKHAREYIASMEAKDKVAKKIGP